VRVATGFGHGIALGFEAGLTGGLGVAVGYGVGVAETLDAPTTPSGVGSGLPLLQPESKARAKAEHAIFMPWIFGSVRLLDDLAAGESAVAPGELHAADLRRIRDHGDEARCCSRVLTREVDDCRDDILLCRFREKPFRVQDIACVHLTRLPWELFRRSSAQCAYAEEAMLRHRIEQAVDAGCVPVSAANPVYWFAANRPLYQ
jgi:hypothetical protein